jgi:hypothetical protein
LPFPLSSSAIALRVVALGAFTSKGILRPSAQSIGYFPKKSQGHGDKKRNDQDLVDRRVKSVKCDTRAPERSTNHMRTKSQPSRSGHPRPDQRQAHSKIGDEPISPARLMAGVTESQARGQASLGMLARMSRPVWPAQAGRHDA